MKIKDYWLFIIGLVIMSYSCKNEKDRTEIVIAYLQTTDQNLSITPVETGLEVPWDIDASLPDKIWYTEQNGSVYLKDLKAGSSKFLM